jgi:hypothetical protein
VIDAFEPKSPKERMLTYWGAFLEEERVNGYIIITQERLLFLKKKAMGKPESVLDVNLEDLTNIEEVEIRGGFKRLRLNDGKRHYQFKIENPDAVASLLQHLCWARQGYATAFLEEHGFETELVTSCIEPMRAGQFDTAVRNAYILLETKIRHTVLAEPDMVGADLVDKAFHHETGMLNFGRTSAEKQGLYFLYRGAIQAIRNPITHDLDQGYSKDEAFRMIAFVDVLLKMMNQGLDLKKKGRLR